MKEVKSESERFERECMGKKARLDSEWDMVEDELNKKKARLGNLELLEGKIDEVAKEAVYWKMQYEALESQHESTKVENGEKYQLLKHQYSLMLGKFNREIGLDKVETNHNYIKMHKFLTPEEIITILLETDPAPGAQRFKKGWVKEYFAERRKNGEMC